LTATFRKKKKSKRLSENLAFFVAIFVSMYQGAGRRGLLLAADGILSSSLLRMTAVVGAACPDGPAQVDSMGMRFFLPRGLDFFVPHVLSMLSKEWDWLMTPADQIF
jgi:hypothetical protein